MACARFVFSIAQRFNGRSRGVVLYSRLRDIIAGQSEISSENATSFYRREMSPGTSGAGSPFVVVTRATVRRRPSADRIAWIIRRGPRFTLQNNTTYTALHCSVFIRFLRRIVAVHFTRDFAETPPSAFLSSLFAFFFHFARAHVLGDHKALGECHTKLVSETLAPGTDNNGALAVCGLRSAMVKTGSRGPAKPDSTAVASCLIGSGLLEIFCHAFYDADRWRNGYG